MKKGDKVKLADSAYQWEVLGPTPGDADYWIVKRPLLGKLVPEYKCVRGDEVEKEE